MIVLVVITASSITALFLRGFKFNDIKDQFTNQYVKTPELKVWLLGVTGYDNKMDAYKAGLKAADSGLGVYVLPEKNRWSWVAGVYPSANEAEMLMEQFAGTWQNQIEVKSYQIISKKFFVENKALVSCQQVLCTVQSVFNLLLDLRNSIINKLETNNLQVELTNKYNEIKSCAEKLNQLNANFHNDFIATIIYTANQNILALQEIIFKNNDYPSISEINTALLMTIFSLDNF